MLDHIDSQKLERTLGFEVDRIEYAHDLSGNFTFLNKVGELISGYSAQEACRMNISQLVTPEFIAEVNEQVANMREQGLGLVFEIEIVTKNGARLRLEVSTRLVMRDGHPVGVQGIAVPAIQKAPNNRIRQQCVDKDFVRENLCASDRQTYCV
jgi:PAS domain S-box-containing protein